jgi:penicillin amidase
MQPVNDAKTTKRLPILALAALAALQPGCRAADVVRYVASPDYPRFTDGEVLPLAGLTEPVHAAERPDGLWRIAAANEEDALLVLGFLQARDRLAQLDLFRHMARGELAAWIGDRLLGERRTLDLDRLNRFLGFRRDAPVLYEAASAPERAAFDAFVRGINLWIARSPRPIEHRLAGVPAIRPWTAEDSIAIYLMIMHGLSGNADREIRRLRLACEAGLEVAERVWPSSAEFAVHVLPDGDLRQDRYAPAPAVVPELAAELPVLCKAAAEAERAAALPPRPDRGDKWLATEQLAIVAAAFANGFAASNNWAVAGSATVSGRPLLSTDPHLPHMNPPLLWGVDLEIPGMRVAGFTLPGLHRVVFGHNGHMAWGATTNYVDRQDLFVHRPRSELRDGKRADGYEVDGAFVPFELRSEVFDVRGAEPVTQSVRFTAEGPLVNDLEPDVAGTLPPTALRPPPLGRGTDLDAARAMNRARDVNEFTAALDLLDLGCSSWVFADTGGNIAFRGPCLVPVREGWRGTFPAPGWNGRYAWRGLYAKNELPASTNPPRGWLATANNQIVPSDRFPTTYNNDAAGPNRFLRIARRLGEQRANGGLDPASSAAIQLDVGYEDWESTRASLGDRFCNGGTGTAVESQARRLICDWDGSMDADSPAATLYVLWTNAILDRALADEIPGGRDGDLWRWLQSLFQFEANAGWLWTRPEDDPVWDDVRTQAVERRSDILDLAFADAVGLAVTRYGSAPVEWQWGRVRPFVLHHPFAPGGGILGRFLNSPALRVGGDTETVFKQQFARSDRERMQPVVGPIIRLTVDLADPWAATYSLAGGQSGWPGSPFYGNLLADWGTGRGRPLTPAPSAEDVRVRFVPAP